MGLLSFIKKSPPAEAPSIARLPSGSLTVDAAGRVVISTIPRSFPEAVLKQINELVLATFRTAREVNLPLLEIVADFAGLKLTAREMRGGAIIFLAPRTFAQK